MEKKIEIGINDIRQMVKESVEKIISESVSSIVYHYTHPSSLISIIENNRFEMSDDGGMSVTRQRNDRVGYGVAFRHEYFDGCYVRIQLDGDKLNERYRGTQVDEFGLRGKVNTGDFNGRGSFVTQAEDKIYSRNGRYIPDAIKYIRRIDIMFPIYDNRYDSYIRENEEFINRLINLVRGSEWEGKIYFYFDDEFMSNRVGFNHQTSNCLGIRDVIKMIRECKERIIEGKEVEYDILYRGGDGSNSPVLWLTTSKDYAKNYSNNIYKYKVPISILDRLASEKVAMKYLINETDEYPFYEAEYFNINKMILDGYTGYYFYESEYKCLNVCLFNKDNATKMGINVKESVERLTEALIIEPYIGEIDKMTNYIVGLLKKFKSEIGKWEREEEEDGSITYYRNVGKIDDVNIVVIRNPWYCENMKAAYSSNENEIWIYCRGNESASWIYNRLCHEMTHKMDKERGYAYNVEKFNAFDLEDLPRCFSYILNTLWNESEFNAYQAIAVNGEYEEIKSYINMLWGLWEECSEYGEDEDIWKILKGDEYLGMNNISSYRVRKYFLNTSSKLIEKMKRKLYRKVNKFIK